MKIEDFLNFKYTFLVEPDKENDVKSVNVWLKENCQGQWFITGQISDGKLFSPAKYKSPLSERNYEPSSISVSWKVVLMLELEEDATLFKLTFGGES